MKKPTKKPTLLERVRKRLYKMTPAYRRKRKAAMERDGRWFAARQAEKDKDFEAASRLYRIALDASPDTRDFERKLLDNGSKKYWFRRHIAFWLHDHLDEIRRLASEIGVSPEPARKIFTLWSQGFDQAPDVVQLCHRNLLATHRDDDLIILTDENYRDYARLPDDIEQKLASQPKQFFADILRVLLVARHGGIWVDATCWANANLIDIAKTFPSGSFHAMRKPDSDVGISNWFLQSEPGHIIPSMMGAALIQYWRNFDSVVEYYFFHYIFEALTIIEPEFGREWGKSARLEARPAHRIQMMMRNRFSVGELHELLEGSFIHKLTYKMPWPPQRKAALMAELERILLDREAHRAAGKAGIPPLIAPVVDERQEDAGEA